MDASFIIAQILGLLSLLTDIIAMQWKHRKHILYFVCLTNIICVIQFALLGAYCGSCLCGFGVIQVLVNQHWVKKEEPVPKLLLLIYALTASAIVLLTFQKHTDLFLIVSCWMFPLKTGLKDEQAIRKVSLTNSIFFTCFDISVGAYTNIIGGLLTITSTVIALIRYRKNKKIGDSNVQCEK